ncbi:MAG: transposase [Frankiales bacterium]|nr:transposase [Frankiales bacterium]
MTPMSMSEAADGTVDRSLHVVFGAGQVGRAVTSRLAGLGLAVRSVSRHRPADLVSGVDWRSADLTDAEAAIDAAKGAGVLYQCLNAPYTQWPQLFPPLQRTVLATAERAGALLVTLENVYGYGPTAGKAMTGELLAADKAGRVQIAIGRASDFFGPGVTESTLGSRVFGNAVGGKRADFIGDPDLLHTYSYVPDIATGLVTLGTDQRAIGQIWHLPGPETVTTRALLESIAREVEHPVGVRNVPKLMVSVLGVVSPMMRGLAEMSYEFERPFVLDTSKYQATFTTATTPLATAISDTIAWYRTHRSTP